MIKNYLKEYFSFSKSERNGSLVLVVIILILLSVYFLFPKYVNHPEVNFAEFVKEIDEFEQSQNKKNNETNLSVRSKVKPILEVDKIEFFEFDPNDITITKWKQLGLPDKTINTIKNYLNKGGRFYTPGDMRKIYGLDSGWFKKAEPYIRIEENYKTASLKKAPESNTDSEISIIDINSADSASLIGLQGIGPVFAGRIPKYRNLLGGYTSKEQLLEVYGFPEETLENIDSFLTVDTNKITKIDLNKADYLTLIKHPYLNKFSVRGIINYRNIQGEIKNIEELKTNRIITEKTFRKIQYYLVTGNENSN